MKLENPWIGAACDAQGVPVNRLPTFLQEQYGQLGEDLILEGLLKSAFVALGLAPASVRYLEIGANHPVQTSNTYLFSRKWGGRGVLVEANSALVPALERVRPGDTVLNLAVVPEPGLSTVRLNVSENTELSSIDLGHLQSFGALARLDRTVEVPAITLDRLLTDHCDGDVHLMSIDIEGVDLEVLARARFPRRPLMVVTEPSRHYHRDAEAGFRRVMQGHGYFELARTDYNLVFADADAFRVLCTPSRPLATTTFDIFDTLIARRCVQPEAVFLEVERRTGVDGFARVRYAAERAVEAGDYTLDDIYSHVARLGQIDARGADALKAAEVAVEIDNVVPIADHIARLQSDSVLVTDMYLPEDALRAMLGAAGVPSHLCLLRTSRGKRTGEVWRSLAAHGVACDHLGDNPVADLAQATAHGMSATLTAVAMPTPTERRLTAAGCGHIAQAVRAARLMTPRGDLPAELHRLQVDFNLPLLLLSALDLHRTAPEQSKLLFSSRDGLFLQQVYQATGPGRPGAYWYTSRVARSGDDAAYLAYCREVFGPRPLVVDLCGTGASMARLRERLGLSAASAPLYVTEWIESPGLEAGLAARYGLADVPRPLHLCSDRALVPNEVLELLNYVPEGMVRGVHRVPGGFVPDRAAIEFDPRLLAQVTAQARFVASWAGNLARVLSPAARLEFARLSRPAVAALSESVAQLGPEVHSLLRAWLPAHRAQERAPR